MSPNPSNRAKRPDPSNKPRCRGHTPRGPCRNFPVKGSTVCRMHGGAARQVRRKAAERVAGDRAQRMAERYAPAAEPISDPLSALLTLAGEIAGFKDFVGARVAELRAESWRYEGINAEQLRAELALYERSLDRAARVLVDINRLDLEERLVRVSERQAEQVAAVVTGVLDELDLSPEQAARVPEVVPRRLRAIAGGAV